MAFQKKFLPINIDREENIVSLCPICHRAVHFGNKEEKLKRLNILFEKRKDSLNSCNLSITFEILKKYYL
jgi:5-methylcytosine-specific restriction protein A